MKTEVNQNPLKDKFGDELNVKTFVTEGYQLEIASPGTDIQETLGKLNEIIEKGKEKSPLLESITHVDVHGERIFIKFEEKAEPSLLERENEDQFVACLLYPPLSGDK